MQSAEKTDGAMPVLLDLALERRRTVQHAEEAMMGSTMAQLVS